MKTVWKKPDNFVLASLICVLLSGCMVGPDYSRPQTPADTGDSYFYASKHITDANEAAGIGQWWERFGDPATSSLVLEALEKNYDLQAAAARVLQARAGLAQIRGRQLPEVSYNFGYDRSKRSFKFAGTRFSSLATTFGQDISVSYALDLFGKLKRAERAAWADMLAAETNQWALVNSMIATVIRSRIQVATIQRRLNIARANTESWQRTLEIVERRYSQGLVGPVDVRLARENLAASKAVEPRIEETLITARHGLDVLLARRPGSSEELAETLPDLPDLEPVGVGVPAWLLDRRPDVKTAELALQAGSERIGVSVAELFPDLTLTGSLGRSADRWRDIWKDETEVYSAALRLVQPVFRGGQLRAQVEAAKARYAELAANYADTVLQALREVEDALVTEQMLQRQLEYVEVRFDEASAAEVLAQERYQRGVENILTVLEAQRRRRLAENELVILKGRIWTTRVNLFLAIGGDWTFEQEAEEEQGIADDRQKTNKSGRAEGGLQS